MSNEGSNQPRDAPEIADWPVDDEIWNPGFPPAYFPKLNTAAEHVKWIVDLAKRDRVECEDRMVLDLHRAVNEAPFEAAVDAARRVHWLTLDAAQKLQSVLEKVPWKAIMKYGSRRSAENICKGVKMSFEVKARTNVEIGRDIYELVKVRWNAEQEAAVWQIAINEFTTSAGDGSV
nr:hypothetical protein CFP56_73899 [Quercus suber]